MFVRDNFIHSTYAKHSLSLGMDGKKVALLKKDIRKYYEEEEGTRIFTNNYEDELVITMSYDDLKKELTETIC